MISPGLIVLVGLIVYAPIIVLIITALVAFKRLTQQNLFQRYDWYWIKLTGAKNIILYAITFIGMLVAAIVVWRVLQVWQLRPTNSGDWLSYMGQYATYTGVSVLYALIATTLWLPAFMVIGRKAFLLTIRFRRSSVADVVNLEETEQAIQRRSAVDKAAEYGLDLNTRSNDIRPKKTGTVSYAPLPVKNGKEESYAFGVVVPRLLTASTQENPHWQINDKLVVPKKPGNARAIVIAESGAGKTELLNSIMMGHRAQGDTVIFTDGKGDQRDADELVENHGAVKHNGGYDFFAGSNDDVLERLMKLVPTTESTTFYADEARGVIRAVMDTWDENGCADIEEFGALWDIAVLEEKQRVEAEETTPYLTETLQGVQRHRRVWDTLQARMSQVEQFHEAGGYTVPRLLDAGGLHVIPIVAEDEGDVLLANLLMHDLRRYLAVKKRAKEAVPGVMVIDEFAQIVRENLSEMPAPKMAASMFETTRSLNMGLYIAGQSLSSIAEDVSMQKRLTQAGAAIIVGRGKDSEEEANAFGTVFHAESTGDASGLGAKSTRAQHTYRVSPEWIRSLPNGVFYFAQRGSVRQLVVLPTKK